MPRRKSSGNVATPAGPRRTVAREDGGGPKGSMGGAAGKRAPARERAAASSRATRTTTRKSRGAGNGGVAKTAVLVAGMHRSGTSALARVLNFMGCTLPGTLLEPNFANEAGYWESEPVVRLNDDILASAGSAWDDWQAFDPAWYASPVAGEFRERALEVLESEYGRGRLFVLKDPRMCRMLPFWIEAARSFGADPLVAVTVRNPLDVAASLEARDGIDPSVGYLMWLRNVLDAEAASREVRRGWVRYERLLSDPLPAVDRLGAEIGVSWPRRSSIDAELETREFLSPGLRHHRSEDTDPPADPMLSRWAGAIFEILDRWARGRVRKTDTPALNRIRSALDEAAPVFGRVVSMGRKSLAERDGRIEELNRTVVERDGRIEEFARSLSERDGRIEALDRAVAERAGRVDELARAATERDGLVDGLNRTVTERDWWIEGLSRGVTERDGRIEGLNQTLIERDGRIGELNETLAERDGRIEKLARAATERDEQVEELVRTVAERDGRVEKLARAVAGHDGQVEALNRTVAERDERVEELARAVAERDGRAEALVRTVAEREGQVEALNRAVAERDGRVEKLARAVAEHGGRVEELVRTVAERGGQVEELNRAVAERDGRVEELVRTVAERDGRVEELVRTVAERGGQVEELNRAVAERDGRVEELVRTVAERDGRVEELVRTVAERDGRFEDLARAVAERGGRIEELTRTGAERDGRVEELNRAVAEHNGRVEELNRAVAERDGRVEELVRVVAERDGRVEELVRAVAERDGRVEELTRAAAERDERVEELTRAAAERDERVEALTRAAAERDGQVEEFLRTVAERGGRIEELARAVTERDGRIEELTRAAAERDGRVEALARTVAERDGRVEALARTVAERDGRVEALARTVAERDGRVEALARTVAERDGRVEALARTVAERDRRVEALARTVAERDGRVEALARTVAERDRRAAELAQAVADRDGRVNVLEQALARRDHDLAEIYDSNSWQVTAPLRFLRRAPGMLAWKVRVGLSRTALWLYRRIPLRPAVKQRIRKRLPGFVSRLLSYPPDGPKPVAREYYAVSRIDLADHAFAAGKDGDRFPILFDPAFYLDSNDDVRNAGVDPLDHYLEWGAAEGRMPLGDVRSDALHPLVEHVHRSDVAGDEHADFDAAFYRAAYADLPDMDAAALAEHYESHGRGEGRIGSVRAVVSAWGGGPREVPLDFDPDEYAELYPWELAALRGLPIHLLGHYMNYGRWHGKPYSRRAFRVSATPSRTSPRKAPTPSPPADTPPLCVLAHVYYAELWDELSGYLGNLPEGRFALYVNLVDTTLSHALVSRIRDRFPFSRIYISENRGRDIGGFVRLLKNVRIDDYRIYGLFHTKMSPYFQKYGASLVRDGRTVTPDGGKIWRERIFTALMGTRERAAENVDRMLEDETIGEIAPASCRRQEIGKNPEKYHALLDRLGIGADARDVEFASGTMGFLRADVLRRVFEGIRDLPFEKGDGQSMEFHMDGQWGHAVERIIGNVVRDMGYRFEWR